MPAKNAASLHMIQADYQVLYQKLRSYHWRVTGPMFFGLHQKFEELYDDTALKVDEIAERIVTQGGRPLSTLAEVLEHTSLAEDGSENDARKMVENLVGDYESMNAGLRSAAEQAAAAGDSATVNLLEAMADGQEKTAWMLRAYLG